MTEYIFENGFIIRGDEKIPVYGEYDVVVAGGGMAGVGAALGAAKNGAKTMARPWMSLKRQDWKLACFGRMDVISMAHILSA